MLPEPKLRDVSSPLPDVPYPTATRSAGWRFSLDTTRIRQSDTWTLARPEVRPWLLMLWMVAWEECPCGSLPTDESLIAAKLGIDAALFAAHRSVLIRGWKRCSDGRLYHDVLSEYVIEMIETREGNRKRQTTFRNKSRVINPLVTPVMECNVMNKKALPPAPVDNSQRPVDNSPKWWKTLDSIIATGRPLGIIAAPGETRESLYQRTKAALKAQGPKAS